MWVQHAGIFCGSRRVYHNLHLVLQSCCVLPFALAAVRGSDGSVDHAADNVIDGTFQT